MKAGLGSEMVQQAKQQQQGHMLVHAAGADADFGSKAQRAGQGYTQDQCTKGNKAIAPEPAVLHTLLADAARPTADSSNQLQSLQHCLHGTASTCNNMKITRNDM